MQEIGSYVQTNILGRRSMYCLRRVNNKLLFTESKQFMDAFTDTYRRRMLVAITIYRDDSVPAALGCIICIIYRLNIVRVLRSKARAKNLKARS